MPTFDVAWSVTGSSQVDVTNEDLAEAARAGFDVDESPHAVFEFLNKKYDNDLLSEAADEWYERDRPEIIQVELEED